MIRNKDLDAEVIIVGGGLAGSTLAALLARNSIRSLIIEERDAQPDLERIDPRTLAITVASENILKAVGAWQLLPPERIGHFRRMFVWDEQGAGDIEFDSAELCEPTLGFIIEQTALEWALQHANKQSGLISWYRPTSVKSFNVTDQSVSVQLVNGQTLTASLVTGADGAKSAIRTLAGIPYPVHDYHQNAVACIVETEKPHESVARQRFLVNGPLAFLPMADANHCGVVWSTAPDHASQLLAMDESTFNRELAESFAHTLGDIVNSKLRAGFPLQHAQASRYCLPRFALIGDAAHCVHPLAGQGANLGLLDAATLSEVISDAYCQNRDLGAYAVLRRYERWRKGENFLMLKMLQGFKMLFESRLGSVRFLRNTGLDLTDMMSPVKHAIMRYAMGLCGDLPAVARIQYDH
jgi:2-polyprenylphenol 6-hydroxylase